MAEIPSPALGAAELDRTDPIIEHALYLGMDAVLIRPSLLDVDTEMDSIRRFIDKAGEQGLRTIVRISGALGPITAPYAKQTTGFVTGLEQSADDLLRRSHRPGHDRASPTHQRNPAGSTQYLLRHAARPAGRVRRRGHHRC